MNKAFIFDMDGVLVDSERAWEPVDAAIWEKIVGSEVRKRMGSLLGMSLRSSYEKAIQCGSLVDYEKLLEEYAAVRVSVYAKSTVTKGVDTLAGKLVASGFRLGLVSSSHIDSINQVLPRLQFANKLEVVISLNDTPSLRPKPSPDGYVEALKRLDADPKTSFILEDSNLGIQAAKASGAYVIGLREHLLDGYEQTGADAYADTMDDVAKLVKEFDARN